MIGVEVVDLNDLVVLPSVRVGMVIAQPFYHLSDQEPYQWLEAAKGSELQAIEQTLELAKQCRHGEEKTHFTIFPEYSIPGIDGINLIYETISAGNWPNGTIVIGGTDALTKENYRILVDQGYLIDTNRNHPDQIEQNEWLNCCIVWIKTLQGEVRKWIQPKISRARPESDIEFQEMFVGRSIFSFQGSLDNGSQYRFSTVICYDWIASVGPKKVWEWLAHGLDQGNLGNQGQLTISWLFVIQCNPKPSHHTFLSEVEAFFDQTKFQNIRRERSCLVFANCAGSSSPSRATTFGASGLIFTQQTLFATATCPPTYCNGGTKFRQNTILGAYKDILFRERGACVHSFVQFNPDGIIAGPAGTQQAIERAQVFPLNGTMDPRVPSASVPAVVKWWNDELDTAMSVGTNYPQAPLTPAAKALHPNLIIDLRVHSAQVAKAKILLATSFSTAETPDQWDSPEAHALRHILHSIEILKLANPTLTVKTELAHATYSVDGDLVDVVAIHGATHEECIEHSKDKFVPRPRRRTVLISRDLENAPWLPWMGSILKTPEEDEQGERKITQPNDAWSHVSYQQIFAVFLGAPDTQNLATTITAQLST